MLTAEQARAMRPNWNWQHAAERIETMVRLCAPSGRNSIDLPCDLIPDNGVGRWALGQPNAEAEQLALLLEMNGYRIELNSGGHHGRGYVRIHW